MTPGRCSRRSPTAGSPISRRSPPATTPSDSIPRAARSKLSMVLFGCSSLRPADEDVCPFVHQFARDYTPFRPEDRGAEPADGPPEAHKLIRALVRRWLETKRPAPPRVSASSRSAPHRSSAERSSPAAEAEDGPASTARLPGLQPSGLHGVEQLHYLPSQPLSGVLWWVPGIATAQLVPPRRTSRGPDSVLTRVR